ncbi:MAG: SDR family oxidoreductase [Rhodobacteraceae bacterium]|nr:MAG: SDR family oxidoreductase [Paracoccaceae bacterium]
MGALTLLITGATGYVGRATVAEARRKGHAVLAVTRSDAAVPGVWREDAGIEVLTCDLAEGAGLEAVCARADVVLHLAASLSGDARAHARDTLAATERLLAAMPKGGKLVHLSSIAVYDMGAVAPGDLITETTPLIDVEGRADTYARAKRAQEVLVQQAARDAGLRLTILRAGAVFGPGRLWNAHLGLPRGGVLLRLGNRGQIPLAHVSTCAQALVAAGERPATGPINLLDEDLPDRRRFLKALHPGPRLTLPLGWRWMLPLAGLTTRLAGPSRVPGLMNPAVLRARFLPVSYDNSRMREVLGLRQAQGFEALMHAAQNGHVT